MFRELSSMAVETTGGDGAATGSGSTDPTNGVLWAYYVDYDGSAPATTVITVKDSTGRTLFAGAAGNTDGLVYPRGGASDDQFIPVAGRTLTFELSLSDALEPAATITPIMLEV